MPLSDASRLVKSTCLHEVNLDDHISASAYYYFLSNPK